MQLRRCIHLFFLFTLVFCEISFAQKKFDVKIIVSDSVKTPIPYATVCLLIYTSVKKDSVCAETDSKGIVFFRNIQSDSLEIKISCIGFRKKVQALEIKTENKSFEYRIQLSRAADYLREVIIQNRVAPIIIHGDTVEYLADSFKVRSDANLEDLLKKLPGVKIYGGGTIVAQGKPVTKIKVNGQDFFLDDPKIALENLPVKSIAKIQISDDNESSQSDVLGLGEKNKIINVQLKKILNHYLFGKLEDGGGIKDKVFLNNAINYFSDSTQYSAFLNYNNMNYSLPYSNTPFFGSLNTLISANNQISSNFGGAGGIGSIVSNNDAGFITMMNGPVLGTNDRFSTGLRGTMPFPNSRARLYLSVVYVHNSGTLLDSASGYEIFSSDKYRTLGNDLLNRSSDLARVFLNWTCQLNSHSTLKIAPAFTFYKSVDSSYSRSTISQYDTSLNTYTTASDPRTSSSTQGLDFSYLNDFSSRFRVVLSGNSQLVNTSPQKSVNSYLIVKNEEGGNISTLNAQGLQWTLNPKLFLSYAISRKISTQASYAVYYDNSKSNIEILSSDYANSINQKQEVNFVDRSLAQDGQANARWRNKVWEIDLGGGYYKVDFIRSGNDSFSFKNEEAYFYPTFAIKYSRSKLDQFSVEVNSRFHIPTVTQLLPILDSTDRVHLTVGNPLLKPEFLPQLNASYSRIDVVGGNILLIRYSLVEAVNKIIYRYYKLGDGRTLSMPVNSNSGTNNRLYYDFSKTFYNGKLEIAAGGAMSIAHYVAYDSATNYYNIQRFQQNISLNFISTHLESRTSFNIAPSYNQFSSQSFSATDFSVDQIVSLFFLPFKFEVTADYLHPSGYFLVTERNIFNLGCSAEYPIYKRLVLHLQARDLLNMTRFNYARNLTGNILDDKTYNTVGRFVMASLIFKFNTFTSK